MREWPELRDAPAPFLNRFEKYRLTHLDLLKAHCLTGGPDGGQLPSGYITLIDKVLKKAISLLEFLNIKCFYGARELQTVESALLEVVATEIGSLEEKHVARSPAVQALQGASPALIAAVKTELEGDSGAYSAAEDTWNSAYIARVLTSAVSFLAAPEKGAGDAEARTGVVMLGQLMLQSTVRKLLQLVTPEQLYKSRSTLPADLLGTYFTTHEHFSFKRLLSKTIRDRESKQIMCANPRVAPLHDAGSNHCVLRLSQLHTDQCRCTCNARLWRAAVQ
eukprot:3866718-Prymnesium_polylepis.1